jgi:hypothetical protein
MNYFAPGCQAQLAFLLLTFMWVATKNAFLLGINDLCGTIFHFGKEINRGIVIK